MPVRQQTGYRAGNRAGPYKRGGTEAATISLELAGGRVLRLSESISTERLVALIEMLQARTSAGTVAARADAAGTLEERRAR